MGVCLHAILHHKEGRWERSHPGDRSSGFPGPRRFTLTPAGLPGTSGKKKYIGSIEPGKWGSLVVIDKDYLTVPEDQITDSNPLLTIVGGKVSYSEPKFAASQGLPTVGFQAPPNWWDRRGHRPSEGM